MDDELDRQLQRFYNYAVRCGEWIRPYTLTDLEREAWSDAELKQESLTEGGKIWSVQRVMPWGATVGLINMCGVENPRWDLPHASPLPIQDTNIHLAHPRKPSRVVWSSPEQDGAPKALSFEYFQGEIRLVLPHIHYAGMVTIYD